MNIDRIENNKLRRFMERNPEATFRDIVEFTRQEFSNAVSELAKTYTSKLERALDSNDLSSTPRRLEDTMEPAVRQTRNMRNYQELQYSAVHEMRAIENQVGEIAESHSESFINTLKDVIDSEFDEIGTYNPNSRTDLDFVYANSNKKMNIRKDDQDAEDRRMVANLRENVRETKQQIHSQFVELSKADIQMYGIIYEPGHVSQNTALVDRITSKANELVTIFNSTSEFFESGISSALSRNNDGILQEVQGIIRDCRRIIDEAVYQISKEKTEEELRQEDQRRLENSEKMRAEDQEFEARREALKREEQELEERFRAKREAEQRSESFSAEASQSTDLSDIRIKYDKDEVLFEPSAETYHTLMEAGMPMNVISKYIWDGFVRTIDADEKLRFGEITQEAHDKELATIQKVEEILFSELVAGENFEDARATAEDVALNGKEYTSKDKSENDGFTYSFDNILISASDDTREILVNAGMPENCVDAYIWDRFVRMSSLDSNLENGKISQEEYDEKAELVNRTEELLFDGLVQGKSIDEARAVAEDRAAREATVSIIPSPETQQILEEAGLSSEDAKKYVWDAFVRTQLINEALEKGQITEEQKDQQLANVDNIERALLDGLRDGKNFSEARRDAETGKKSAVQDISEDSSITTTKVANAGKFIEEEVKGNEQTAHKLDADFII